ncbi:MAG: sulfide/dihydroorotate dehydrogenase-like FAD/NAD-binding protein [Clostridiales bacterium]|nr:sulfide/dihydroorotate dehydrogenase-like FAD/NAD-binding protein [Clostridiales bacterium]
MDAPDVAKYAKAGQFVILRVDDEGERVPFTICDYDSVAGTVTIAVQEVGYSTHKLAEIETGGYICDFVGPLGNPTDLSAYKNIVLVGGGIGTAVIYPQAKALQKEGKPATVIVGARTASLLLYQDELKAAAKRLITVTDDGTSGKKGFVTNALTELLPQIECDCVLAVGPMPMMRAVCALTKGYGIKTIVSMNSVMVDGTGMCGGCRVRVGGKTAYACVDGPEFDGHEIDWEDAINRLGVYREHEQAHYCRLKGKQTETK